MKNILAVSFDLDDTLWETESVIQHAENTAYQWLMEHCPRIVDVYSVDDIRELRLRQAQQNPGLQHNVSVLRRLTYEHCIREMDYPIAWVETVYEVFFEARHAVTFYDDVMPVLQKLKAKYQLMALSNGNAEIDRVGLGDYFNTHLTAEKVGVAKPSPDFFETALKHLNLKAHQVVHIGDDPVADVMGAKHAGFYSIWLNRHETVWLDSKKSADSEIKSLYELLEIL